ncbi:hypothetical protein ASPCAL07456 [Aspergillus calidoustus]|uniref:Uncharacterized protein n=1 Tax=Aspergillus calidoustus TaxID=454130 RepID=A0A0U5G6X5_ASPCI|nr:hypothetical protein ASPCAL07456 [Aspergillus calidoustus]
MAPPLSSDSLTSLHALQDAARKHSRQAPEISLPERPRNFQNDSPYSDAAIGVVSVYTTHLYNEHGSWATEVNGMRQDIKAMDNKVERFEHGAKEALTDLSGRLDDVEKDLKELRKEVKDVQSQVKDVQSQVKDVQSQVKDVQSQFTSFQQEANSQFDHLRCQFAELQSSVSNTTAIQLNALRKWLDDPIEPISALVSAHGKLASVIAPDFPQTVRELWQLNSNIPALVRLSKHYSVTGWERWQRSASDDTDRTDFADLDIAVAAYPHRCLMALSSKWGLQYAFLERPRKRLAETEDELEITHLRPPQPVPSDSVISRVYEKYAGAPGRTSFESALLGWDANIASEPSLRSGKSHRS